MRALVINAKENYDDPLLAIRFDILLHKCRTTFRFWTAATGGGAERSNPRGHLHSGHPVGERMELICLMKPG